MNKAIHLYNQEQLKKARRLFQKVPQNNPRHPDALYFLGRIELRQVNWYGAVFKALDVVKNLTENRSA